MTSTLMKAESALAKSEQELYEAMTGAFESFYSQGVILRRIMVDMEFKNAGFESFADYMNERQPCGIQMRQAYRLIQATEVRKLLPVLSDSDNGIWSEWTIRPLLHKDFEPSDQKRLGKKIATRVKNGEKLTAALVKQVCDAQILLVRMTQDMCLEASRPGRNAKSQVLHLDMLLPYVKYFCAAQLLVGMSENSSDLRRLVQSVMQRRRCFTSSCFCPLVK